MDRGEIIRRGYSFWAMTGCPWRLADEPETETAAQKKGPPRDASPTPDGPSLVAVTHGWYTELLGSET